MHLAPVGGMFQSYLHHDNFRIVQCVNIGGFTCGLRRTLEHLGFQCAGGTLNKPEQLIDFEAVSIELCVPIEST